MASPSEGRFNSKWWTGSQEGWGGNQAFKLNRGEGGTLTTGVGCVLCKVVKGLGVVQRELLSELTPD